MTDTDVETKLERGDTLAVVSPSYPLEIVTPESRKIASRRLKSLGLKIVLHEGVDTIEERVSEIHEAYLNPDIDGLISSIGGYRANQILNDIDWDIVAKNPKPFIGFSDITVVLNAIYAKTRTTAYLGPHFSTFGQVHFDEFTAHSFKNVLMNDQMTRVETSEAWTDDLWFMYQEDRNPIENEGRWHIQDGNFKGIAIGGNLCSMNLLQGTEFWPQVEKPIAIVEDTSMSNIGFFDRDLQSLLHAQEIGGLIIGRFQKGSKITREMIEDSVATKKELVGKPVVANVDIGHTLPIATIPIGGIVDLAVRGKKSYITIVGH